MTRSERRRLSPVVRHVEPVGDSERVVLDVNGLTVIDEQGVVQVDDVSFTVRAGEIGGGERPG